MQLVPSRSAFHLSMLGLGAMLTGVAAANGEATLLGGALVLGIALARALAKWGALRSRRSGFEMIWDDRRRLIPAVRSSSFELGAILTNRDDRPLEFSDLELIHAPGLKGETVPRSGMIPRGSSIRVRVLLTPEGAGPRGVFGLSIKTTRPPGLFATPLVFANPLVVLVAPDSRSLSPLARAVQLGGAASRRSFRARDALDFRELREHRSGDPFRRIAWKPSARRGKLLVMETEERIEADTWVLLDISCELALGRIGHCPRDRALDHVASLVRFRLEQGERVGFIAYASRELVRIPADAGRQQWLRLRAALTEEIHTADADRSSFGVLEVEELVFEHARSLDSAFPQKWTQNEGARVQLVAALVSASPYRATTLVAPSEPERILRQYLRSFGIESPPSEQSERFLGEKRLALILGEKLFLRGAPGEVIVVGRLPNSESPRELWRALEKLGRRGTRVSFHAVSELGPETTSDSPGTALIRRALSVRIETTARSARRMLLSRRVRVVSVQNQLMPRE